MKRKHILGLMILCCLLSLHSSSSGITDLAGDNVGPVDLLEAGAEIYERGDGQKLLKVTVDTHPHLPGIVIFECDVDNTGGTWGIPYIPVPPCPCKPEAGIDISIITIIRQQGDNSETAFCKGCEDIQQASCSKGRLSGEWYAIVGVSPLNANPRGIEDSLGIMRGLLDPPPKLPASGETQDCYSFPWGQILEYSHAVNPDQFDWDKSQNIAYNKWQVSVWHDALFADGDDFIDAPLVGPLNISDWAPNSSGIMADMDYAEYYTYCEGNFDGDVDIDGSDAAQFKEDYGRSVFKNPCPSCGPMY
jgi:hypothetical protein